MIYQFRICGVTAAGIQTSYVESVTWPVAPVYQPVLTVTQVGLTIEGSFVDKNNIDAPAALYYVRKSTNGADFVNFQVIKASGIEFGKNIPYYDDLLVTYTFTDTDIIEGNHYVYIVIPWNGGGYLE